MVCTMEITLKIPLELLRYKPPDNTLQILYGSNEINAMSMLKNTIIVAAAHVKIDIP